MGTVYRAWDQQLDVAIALKVIRPDIAANLDQAHDFELRFKQELLLARQVTHRNVIRIHDLGECDGVKYITMQFVEGTDLSRILHKTRLPFERTLLIARQLAAGLAAAHDVGIVHRDLKPLNILVDGDSAYISDFGLAKSLDMNAGLTRTGDFMGTPQYVSPEQVQGEPADHRTDIYALGLIFYEMATGVLPFSGKSVVELMYKRIQEPARDPGAISQDLPDFFRLIVLRCLQRDPKDRYPSARALLADLEAEHAEATAPTPAPPGRTISLTLPVPQALGWKHRRRGCGSPSHRWRTRLRAPDEPPVSARLCGGTSDSIGRRAAEAPRCHAAARAGRPGRPWTHRRRHRERPVDETLPTACGHGRANSRGRTRREEGNIGRQGA